MRWILVFCCLFTSISITSGEDSKTPPSKDAPSKDAPKEITVYITKSGKKYHTADCRYLSKSKIPISLKDALAKYTACSVCNPPDK